MRVSLLEVRHEICEELYQLACKLTFFMTENYRLAKCAVKWVSDCRCAGNEGSDDCTWDGVCPAGDVPAMIEAWNSDLEAMCCRCRIRVEEYDF